MQSLDNIDMRPHPLGIAAHPNWDAVRNAYDERFCNWIARQAEERQKAPRQPLRLGELARGLVVLAAVIGMWWASLALLGLAQVYGIPQ